MAPARYLAAATVKGAVTFVPGTAAAPGAVSTQAAALAEGVLHTMFRTKLMTAAAAVLAVCLAGVGAGLLAQQAAGPKPADDKPAAWLPPLPGTAAPPPPPNAAAPGGFLRHLLPLGAVLLELFAAVVHDLLLPLGTAVDDDLHQYVSRGADARALQMPIADRRRRSRIIRTQRHLIQPGGNSDGQAHAAGPR